ncbi:TPA: hypothetical protein DEP96_04065 [Candidatus Uhrbacteria bacterium]|nr:hypothetical protein [Candidatus Uhrbacteria bacterium]
MVNPMQKLLRKSSSKDKQMLDEALERIEKNDLLGLDVIKLTGTKNLFRVRRGNFRIKFTRDENGVNKVLSIDRRSESTYRDI